MSLAWEIKHSEESQREGGTASRVGSLRKIMRRDLLSGLATATSGGLLAAHVAAELVYASRTVPDQPLVSTYYYFWPAALASSILAFARMLPPSSSTPVVWWKTSEFATSLLILSAGLAWWGNVLAMFALASLASPLILVWIDIARGRGLVRYETQSFQFHVSRTTSYATLRAATEALVVHLGFPVRVADLIPLLVATLETVGMMVRGAEGHYGFTANSAPFLTYATLKSCVFVAIPLAERRALTVLRQHCIIPFSVS